MINNYYIHINHIIVEKNTIILKTFLKEYSQFLPVKMGTVPNINIDFC